MSKIAGEVRAPKRTLPRALTFGIISVTAIYILISAVFLYLVPVQNVASDETFVAQAGTVLFGPAWGKALAVIVTLCVLGSLAALVLSSPRVYYAMARDGLFLSAFAKTHARFGTPANAILLQGTVASLLLFLGTFQQIISYFMFVAIVFLGLTVSGLFVLRRRLPHPADVVMVPVFPFTALSFLFLVALMLFLISVNRPREAALGTLVVLAGIPFYFARRRSSENETAIRS